MYLAYQMQYQIKLPKSQTEHDNPRLNMTKKINLRMFQGQGFLQAKEVHIIGRVDCGGDSVNAMGHRDTSP